MPDEDDFYKSVADTATLWEATHDDDTIRTEIQVGDVTITITRGDGDDNN